MNDEPSNETKKVSSPSYPVALLVLTNTASTNAKIKTIVSFLISRFSAVISLVNISIEKHNPVNELPVNEICANIKSKPRLALM